MSTRLRAQGTRDAEATDYLLMVRSTDAPESLTRLAPRGRKEYERVLRTDKTASRGTAIAIMGQDSVESGRQSVEQRYHALIQERKILSTRKIELEQKLCQFKANLHKGDRIPSTQSRSRRLILEEIKGIQSRLVEIKPAWQKMKQELNEEPNRQQNAILEEILQVLKQIRDDQ